MTPAYYVPPPLPQGCIECGVFKPEPDNCLCESCADLELMEDE